PGPALLRLESVAKNTGRTSARCRSAKRRGAALRQYRARRRTPERAMAAANCRGWEVQRATLLSRQWQARSGRLAQTRAAPQHGGLEDAFAIASCRRQVPRANG